MNDLYFDNISEDSFIRKFCILIYIKYLCRKTYRNEKDFYLIAGCGICYCRTGFLP